MDEDFDFVAIGDIVTDAFIRIPQASIYHDDASQEDKLCLTNGGKIPYESVTITKACGNSPNASVSASRLGLRSALVTNMGDDARGKDNLDALKYNHIDTRFVSIHAGQKSNYHYVLWHKDERTILIKHNDYAYSLPDIGTPKWVYFSSIGENSMDYHNALAEYMLSHPETKMAFQPGSLQVKLGYEKLKKIYAVTDVFFCNLEEAQRIAESADASAAKLARTIAERGPKMVIITDGENGADAFDGKDVWHIDPYPSDEPPLERTGAGDSFASAFTAARALDKSFEEALLWGSINSMSVIHKIGAQEGLLTREELERHLNSKPNGYGPQKID